MPSSHAVIILAAGEQHNFHGPEGLIKQLIMLKDGSTLLYRTVAQVRHFASVEPIVVTHRPFSELLMYNPLAHGCTVESLLSARRYWARGVDSTTTVLLGDVLYSWHRIRRILEDCPAAFWFHGNKKLAEIFAVQFDASLNNLVEKMCRDVVDVFTGPPAVYPEMPCSGKLWSLARQAVEGQPRGGISDAIVQSAAFENGDDYTQDFDNFKQLDNPKIPYTAEQLEL